MRVVALGLGPCLAANAPQQALQEEDGKQVQVTQPHCSTIQYSTVQYIAVQCGTVHSALHCSTVQYSTVQYSTVQWHGHMAGQAGLCLNWTRRVHTCQHDQTSMGLCLEQDKIQQLASLAVSILSLQPATQSPSSPSSPSSPPHTERSMVAGVDSITAPTFTLLMLLVLLPCPPQYFVLTCRLGLLPCVDQRHSRGPGAQGTSLQVGKEEDQMSVSLFGTHGISCYSCERSKQPSVYVWWEDVQTTSLMLLPQAHFCVGNLLDHYT